MSSYVIGYLNQNIGELQLDQVEADTELDALVDYFDLDSSVFTSVDLIQEYACDTDSYVNICQI